MRTIEGFRGTTGVGRVKDCSVLIAVQPPSFQRLLEHVLHGHPGLRVIGASSTRDSASDKAARLAPDVIIASTRLHGREHGDVVADLKRSSPSSTLILLTHALAEMVPHEGADASLPEDAVVRQLLPVIRKVAQKVRDRPARPVLPAGRRA